MTNLILELADLTNPEFNTYITRHTNDKIPIVHLKPFLDRHDDFVEIVGVNESFNLPTVWFVGFFEREEQAAQIMSDLQLRRIKFLETGSEFESHTDINHSYWDSEKDAVLFPIFLYQVTRIGIDILSNPPDVSRLRDLRCLEWLQYENERKKRRDLSEMRDFLRAKSRFYRAEIESDEGKSRVFWESFTKIKITELANSRSSFGS